MKNFSEKLKNALKQRKMTKGRLCELLDISINGIKEMEDRNNMKVETLEEICKILELPLTYFLDVEVKPSEGYWGEVIDSISKEKNYWQIQAHKAKTILEGKGVNFHSVSKRIASCGVFFFFMPNYPQIY